MIPAKKLEYWSALGNIEKVIELLADGHDVNEKGHDGYTALHAAVCNKEVDVVFLLLEHGADVQAKLSGSGATPIDFALMQGNQEIEAMLRDRLP